MTRTRVAVTFGEPEGIGPEVARAALADAEVLAQVEPVLCGEGSAAAQLRAAVEAVKAGRAEALCTGPVDKARVAGEIPGFRGHTEWLQEEFRAERVLMLMAGEKLRVALATTHLALRDVPGALRADELFAQLVLLDRELKTRFGIPRPRIGVCALNPHGGEGGMFGDEESRVIAPAVARAREASVEASGPAGADGLLARAVRGDYDAALAMYHDQGLAAVKALEFENAVNVTLGLPFVRTSPDHGVAYALRGTGRADPTPLKRALLLAARLAARAMP
jgi:4-hydroxythreonine-4-phosphate dehydrogenase